MQRTTRATVCMRLAARYGYYIIYIVLHILYHIILNYIRGGPADHAADDEGDGVYPLGGAVRAGGAARVDGAVLRAELRVVVGDGHLVCVCVCVCVCVRGWVCVGGWVGG